MPIPDFQTVMRPLLETINDGAKKGVFITTSDFSKDAREYSSRIDSKIVLIEGEQLWNLMIDFGIGVSKTATYEVKRVDSDFFSEEIG